MRDVIVGCRLAGSIQARPSPVTAGTRAVSLATRSAVRPSRRNVAAEAITNGTRTVRVARAILTMRSGPASPASTPSSGARVAPSRPGAGRTARAMTLHGAWDIKLDSTAGGGVRPREPSKHPARVQGEHVDVAYARRVNRQPGGRYHSVQRAVPARVPAAGHWQVGRPPVSHGVLPACTLPWKRDVMSKYPYISPSRGFSRPPRSHHRVANLASPSRGGSHRSSRGWPARQVINVPRLERRARGNRGLVMNEQDPPRRLHLGKGAFSP